VQCVYSTVNAIDPLGLATSEHWYNLSGGSIKKSQLVRHSSAECHH
jgi:hypothetical protein